MSSGAKVVTAYAVQTAVNTVPTSGWKIFPFTSNTINNTSELTESEVITDKRLKSKGLMTSAEVAGELESEFMFGVFDDFIEAAFFNTWKRGSQNAPDTLTVSDKKKMFAITKDFTDVNVNHLFTGCHVNGFKLEVNTSDLVKCSFSIMGLGYQSSTTASFAKSPTPAPSVGRAAGQSIGTILVNGQDIGVCVEGFTFEIDNGSQVQRCLGDNLYGGNILPTQASISGTLSIAYSKKAHEILENQRTGSTISLEIPIKFEDNKKYVLKIPKMQVSGEIPSPSGSDLAVAEVSFNVVDDSPVLERHAPTAG